MKHALTPQSLPFMAPSEIEDTKASRIYDDPEKDSTQKLMNLMCHAQRSLQKSLSSAPQLFLGERPPVDLFREVKRDKELHASMDFIRIVLQDTSCQGAQPNKKIPSKNHAKPISPFEYAVEICDTAPELGQMLLRYLNTYQSQVSFQRYKTNIDGIIRRNATDGYLLMAGLGTSSEQSETENLPIKKLADSETPATSHNAKDVCARRSVPTARITGQPSFGYSIGPLH